MKMLCCVILWRQKKKKSVGSSFFDAQADFQKKLGDVLSAKFHHPPENVDVESKWIPLNELTTNGGPCILNTKFIYLVQCAHVLDKVIYLVQCACNSKIKMAETRISTRVQRQNISFYMLTFFLQVKCLETEISFSNSSLYTKRPCI